MTLDPQADRPLVAVVGAFKFPAEDAPGRRVLALAKLLESAGATVHIGSGNPTSDRLPQECPGCEFKTFHLSELPQRTTPRVLRAMRQFVWGGRASAWLATLSPKPAAVVLYGGYSPFSIWLLWFRFRTGIPIVVDAVEWYQPDHVPGGRFGPFRLNVDWALRRLFPKMRNIICISRYLQRHFEAKGCRTLYLPAVLDVAAITPNLEARPEGTHLRLAYTGTPGKKDLLDPMVEALLRIDSEGARIRFVIVGPSAKALLALPALQRRGLTELPLCLEAPGYMTNPEALDQVRRADFSVLLRPRQRYAMAGFPTKVPESLSVGTPLICNLTSDLEEYLVDGSQALICANASVAACEHALDRALNLGLQEKHSMRILSRWLAEQEFDLRHYLPTMNDFLAALRT
jgi:glycosyltransferase involved in cell wall biosynthesis